MIRANIARRAQLFVVVVVFAIAAHSPKTASAGTPASYLPWKYFSSDCFGTALKPGCCPNDYCPKPLPSVCNECRGCCDNYCPKPMPQVCPTTCGTCNDYCPKPWRPMSWCPPCVYRCWPGGCPSK